MIFRGLAVETLSQSDFLVFKCVIIRVDAEKFDLMAILRDISMRIVVLWRFLAFFLVVLVTFWLFGGDIYGG